jgi:small subunit ribosomal protein S6
LGFSEEDAKNTSKKVTDFISEEGGVSEKTTELLKRRLGYPIKKQREAFLVSFYFEMEPEKLADLEKKIKAEDQVLRYLILTKKPVKKTPIPRMPILAEKVPLTPVKEQKKVELKEIDKEIEQILGE